MSPALTLALAQQRLERGERREALVQDALARSQSPQAASVFTALRSASALAAARLADARPSGHALQGLPVTVKDLFDIEGEVTRAGSIVRRDAPPAVRDADAVARLRSVGCAILGRTNMSEFAFSGVGLNPHFGTPRNPCDAAVHRVPGGSSSGAAVSVALGLAVAGLGSDTGGSLRIPAALCGLVGFKPTQRRVSRRGAFELSRTLDSVGAITHQVADALAIDAVLADVALSPVPVSLRGLRLAVAQSVMLDGLDADVARAFDRALACLRDAGATLVDAPLSTFAEIPALNAPGGFSATEAYAVHRHHLDTRRSEFDPRVAARIEPGRHISAADYLQLHDRRRDWIGRTEAALQGFDAFIGPTVPIVAPPLQPMLDDDATFFAINGQLLRNTFVVNYLDGCSFSLPCQRPGDMPVGLMLSSTRGRDAALAGIALAIEAALTRAAR